MADLKTICLLGIVSGLLLAQKGLVSGQNQPCNYHGHTYTLGDAWVASDLCHVCECNEYGVQCWNHETICQINSTTAHVGDPVCLYAQKTYLSGEVFNAVDACNKCLCTERGMQCTAKACTNAGFAKPSKEPIYGECLYEEGWYRYQSQWEAADGCNTCYCYMIGNYRGQHVCTTSKCPCHLNGLISG